MAEIITPERVRARLRDLLDNKCSTQFTHDNLTSAVLDTHKAGEEEVARLTVMVMTATRSFRQSEVPDLVYDRSGQLYSLRAGIDPVIPSSFQVRIGKYPPVSDEPDQFRIRELRFPGRYKLISGICPPNMLSVLEPGMDAADRMLEALQEWIEDRLFLAIEQITKPLTDGVYEILDELDDEIRPGRVDVALVGKRRGQRIPSPHILQRSLESLRASPGELDADILAATFVGKTLPRDELLMSKALTVHHAIVVPFSEAQYVISGSYFGIACQLLDGPQTNVIHPIYESPELSVLLIYPYEDEAVKHLVDRRSAELHEFVRNRLSTFEAALKFIEEPRSTDQADNKLVTLPRYNLLTVLDQVTADDAAANQAEPDQDGPERRRWWPRKRHAE